MNLGLIEDLGAEPMPSVVGQATASTFKIAMSIVRERELAAFLVR